MVNIMVDFIRKETGYTKKTTFGIGYDEFSIKSEEELEKDTIKITFKHFFEEDGFLPSPQLL